MLLQTKSTIYSVELGNGTFWLTQAMLGLPSEQILAGFFKDLLCFGKVQLKLCNVYFNSPNLESGFTRLLA